MSSTTAAATRKRRAEPAAASSAAVAESGEDGSEAPRSGSGKSTPKGKRADAQPATWAREPLLLLDAEAAKELFEVSAAYGGRAGRARRGGWGGRAGGAG